MNHYLLEDTIVAPATVPGTGAISILRISGPEALRIVDRVISFKSSDSSSSKGYRIKYGVVMDSSGDILDEVLVSVFRAPHSYTGEDMAEISCHASAYIASRLTELLLAAGARFAEPGEFTRRAFVNGKMDLSQAEAVADVIAAENEAAHRVAMNQLRGGYSLELAQLRGELLEMTSLLELELDFSEEDVEFADRSRLKELLSRVTAHVDGLIGSFRLGNALRNGVPVAIVGPVNAGKSTLLNALLQDDRAIVSDVAGTTRDTVEETLNIGGILFRFIDTAGLRETDESVEQAGIRRSLKKLSEAEIVLCVLDAGAPPEVLVGDLRSLLGKVDPMQQTVFILLNKTDILGENPQIFYSTPEISGPSLKTSDENSQISGPSSKISGTNADSFSADSKIFGANKNVININKIVSSIDKQYFVIEYRIEAPEMGSSGQGRGVEAVSGCESSCPEAGMIHSGPSEPVKTDAVARGDRPTDQYIPDPGNANFASGAECTDDSADGNSGGQQDVLPGKKKWPISYMEISAREGRNIEELKRRLVESRKDLMSHVEGSLVTNVRHLEALRLARTSLSRVREGLETSLPTDLVARDLRDTIDALGSILGESITTDEILGNVFKNFCIGK